MKKVYVAGPYRSFGDVRENIENAINMGEKLALCGFTPFVPHLNESWAKLHDHDEKFWIEWDNEWLEVCDALIRLPRKSPGSDAEVELAKSLKIPVFYNLEDLCEHFNKRGLW